MLVHHTNLLAMLVLFTTAGTTFGRTAITIAIAVVTIAMVAVVTVVTIAVTVVTVTSSVAPAAAADGLRCRLRWTGGFQNVDIVHCHGTLVSALDIISYEYHLFGASWACEAGRFPSLVIFDFYFIFRIERTVSIVIAASFEADTIHVVVILASYDIVLIEIGIDTCQSGLLSFFGFQIAGCERFAAAFFWNTSQSIVEWILVIVPILIGTATGLVFA